MAKTIGASLQNIKNDWKTLREIRKKSGVSWRKFIHQLATYPNLVEKALELPDEITQSVLTDIDTAINLLPMWMEALSENFELVKKSKDVGDIPKSDKPALIIGAGPSLHVNNHLEMLAETGFDGLIFACDKVLKDCLEAGVVPDYVLILDGSEKILPFIDHDIVDEYSDRMAAIMCVTTHPRVVARWHGDRYFYINSISDDTLPNISYTLHLLVRKTEMLTAGHASSLGWNVAYTLGCDPIILIGIDLSYPIDTPLKKTAYYSRFAEIFGGDSVKILECYTKQHHQFFNTDCYFDSVYGSYIECSMSHFNAVKDRGGTVINCTEGGALEGDGLACAYFKDVLERYGIDKDSLLFRAGSTSNPIN